MWCITNNNSGLKGKAFPSIKQLRTTLLFLSLFSVFFLFSKHVFACDLNTLEQIRKNNEATKELTIKNHWHYEAQVQQSWRLVHRQIHNFC